MPDREDERLNGGQQPLPDRDHAPGDPKENAYGGSEAKPKAGGGKTKYDQPSEAADDFEIDESRDKPIRGNESPKE